MLTAPTADFCPQWAQALCVAVVNPFGRGGHPFFADGLGALREGHGEGMNARFQRQRHRLSLSVRFEHGQDHLGDCPRFMGVAQGLAVVLDGVQKIAYPQAMTGRKVKKLDRGPSPELRVA